MGGELIALEDAEEKEAQVEERSGVYEVVDEDGTVEEMDEEAVEAQQEWADVEEENDEVEDVYEEANDETGVRNNDAVLGAGQDEVAEGIEQSPEPDTSTSDSASLEPATLDLPSKDASSADASVVPPADPPLEPGPLPRTFSATTQPASLPEGFVSPVKRRKLGPRSSRVVTESRRKTLPVQFAPAVPAAAVEEEPEATRVAASSTASVEGCRA